MIKEIRENKKNFYHIIKIFILSRIFVIIIAFFVQDSFESILNLFDAEHYRSIAQNGYTNEMLTAFFPVIPLIIRCIGVYGMLVVNQLAALVTMFLMNSLLDKVDEKNKQLALEVFAFSPLAVFSIVPYTENLFMFLTILVFYLFVKRKWGWKFGVILGLCVATRNSGAMLFFAVFIGCCYLWYKKEISLKCILETYVPATIISCLYPIYLQIAFGNWKIFMDCQNICWGKIDSNIFILVKNQLSVIFNPNHYAESGLVQIQINFYRFNEILTLVFGVSILVLGIYILKSNKFSKDIDLLVAFVYILLSMFCFTLSIRNPLIDSPTTSFYRYFLGLFPIYIGIVGLPRIILKKLVWVMLILTAGIASLFYVNVFFY